MTDLAAAAAAATPAPVSAQLVGNAFVHQYYQILQQSSGLVHCFYHDNSTLGRPEEDGSMSMTTTMDLINDKILSLNYGESRAEIRSVDAQESLNGGVSVLVTGYLTGQDNISRSFVQSFLLAPQEKGYFVLNDMFRFIENATHHEEDHAPSEDVLASETSEQAPESVLVADNNVSEKAFVSTEESHAEKLVPVENGEVSTEEAEGPVYKVVDEVKDSSQREAESRTKIEEVPKKSYASIVMDMKQNGVTSSSPAPAPRKPQPRKVEHLNNAHTTTVIAEPATSNVDTAENGIHEEEEGYSVYIKGLPVNVTNAMLEEEFKRFGPIKPNGIQVRSNWQQGFSFGFVKFEVPDAVQMAIKASPIMINGKNAIVEEKRSANSRGGNQGRFVGGRGGGFRNDGMRNYSGGRGYNRGGDYGNRGGGGSRGWSASNRGGNGYQRDNGRVNRGVDVNGTTRTTTQ